MVRSDAIVGAKFSGQAALTARLMMYVLIAIVLMAMDHRGNYVPKLRALSEYLIEPIYHVVEWPVRALRGTYSFFQGTQSLIQENDNQADQLLAQRVQLLRFDALEEENRRLRALVDGTMTRDFDFQFAELVDVDLDPFSHRVVINRGKDHQVQVGQAVIDGAGVMGQVEEVGLHLSRVRLISDPNHALPVQINRTGLRTVAFGTGDTSRLSLPSLPREADVKEVDLVVTSGLGNRFPGGYPVAVIEKLDRSEGRMFAEAYARPLAALDRGREVLLLKTPFIETLPERQEITEEGQGSEIPEEAAEPNDSPAADETTAAMPVTEAAEAENATQEAITEPGAAVAQEPESE